MRAVIGANSGTRRLHCGRREERDRFHVVLSPPELLLLALPELRDEALPAGGGGPSVDERSRLASLLLLLRLLLLAVVGTPCCHQSSAAECAKQQHGAQRRGVEAFPRKAAARHSRREVPLVSASSCGAQQRHQLEVRARVRSVREEGRRIPARPRLGPVINGADRPGPRARTKDGRHRAPWDKGPTPGAAAVGQCAMAPSRALLLRGT